jgi:hypothetical protein
MMNNIGRVQRNGLKINTESEVNGTVKSKSTNILNQSVFRHYFFTIFYKIKKSVYYIAF